MVEYRIDFEKANVDFFRKIEQKLPKLSQLILLRFVQKLQGLASEDLKRGRWGVTSGAYGRTGRLANSIFANVGRDDRAEIGAGSNVAYARVHEFGGHDTVNVRAHVRSMVFGRSVPPFTVPAHRRTMNIKGKFYLRSTINDFFRSGADNRISEGAFREFKRREGFE